MSVKVVREWGNSLGKKWISCLLSRNIPTTATNHKIAEGPIKQSGSEASMWAVRVQQLFSVIKRPLQRERDRGESQQQGDLLENYFRD